MAKDKYQEGHDDGYDAGYDAGRDGAWQEGYDEALNENGYGEDDKDRNMCLKCDCRKYGFDCIQDDPVGYMKRKIEQGGDEDMPAPIKKVKNSDYDRAMEIFDPK